MKGNQTIQAKLASHNWAIKNYAVLTPDLIYSEAFNSLSKSAIIALIRFLQKRKFIKGGKARRAPISYTNDPIVFTYSEAECFGISRSTFSRVLKELIEKGFIEVYHQGGTIGNGRDWSQFRLIGDWRNYGTDSFRPRMKPTVVQYSGSLRRHNQEKRYSAKNDTRTVSRMTLEGI